MKNGKKILIAALITAFAVVMSLFTVSCKSKDIKLTFVTGEHGTPIAAQTVKKGDKITLPVPEAKDEQWAFDGWYLDAEGSGNSVEEIIAENNTTFYAKWTEKAVITLNLDGGNLSSGNTLYLKAGENIYNFVKDYKPVKSGLTFGAWFDGSSELATSRPMPAGGITLTAKYKVNYTVKTYLQNMNKNGYDLAEKTLTGSDYVGKTVSPEFEVEGFMQVSNSADVDTLVLSATATDNVFEIYYNRKDLTVSYISNGDVLKTETVLYGTKVTVPSDYTRKGYCLLGWSQSVDGDVEYEANYIDSVLYNGADDKKPADEFTPSKNVTLYAVWAAGYADVLGGDDYLFLLDKATGSDIYLLRGGIMFKGTYRGTETNGFYFDISDDEILEGKLITDATFIYRDSSSFIKTRSFPRYDRVSGILNNEEIRFGDYDDITYYVDNESSNGTYVLDEDYNYLATFTTGPKAGTSFRFTIGTVAQSGADTYVFLIRDEVEYGYGTLIKYEFVKTESGDYGFVYYPQVLAVTLSGYNTAVYVDSNGDASACRYTTDENGTIRLLNATQNSTIDYIRVTPDVNDNAYMSYYAQFDRTFTVGENDTLKLDGLYKAVYNCGGKVYEGNYLVENSLFGGVIATFVSSEKNCKFILNSVTDGDETVYTATEKPITYAEYNYKGTSKVFNSIILVTDSEAVGKAVLYGSVADSERVVKVSSGTYQKDAATGYYVYNATEFFNPEDKLAGETDANIDIKKLKTLVYSTGEVYRSQSTYNVHFWFTTTLSGEEETPTDYYVNYLNGNDKLVLIENADMAVFTVEGSPLTASEYAKEGNIITVIYGNGYLYFKINPDDNTFKVLEEAPINAYLLDKTTGNPSNTESLKFDGEGGVALIEYEATGLLPQEKARYNGTYVESENNSYYTFIPDDEAHSDKGFKFLIVSNSSDTYICRYDEAEAGTFTSEEGRLTLDGYGFKANFLDADGNNHEGLYVLPEDNQVLLVTDDEEYIYFDINAEDKTFRRRGAEYSENGYILMNNQVLTGNYVSFDGYGSFEVYTYEEQDGKDVKVSLDTGKYTTDGDEISFSYTIDSTDYSITGKIGVLQYDGDYYPVFNVKHEEIVNTYVSEEDWSVIKVDSYGNVEKFNSFGDKEAGTFSIITEGLLYFVNETSDDANIFVLDGNTVKIPKLTSKGYYTKDLDSLFFTEYGFAIFNGKDIKYYNILDDGTVVIYSRDPSAPNANEYGYVEETFADSFVAQKEYNGKMYYLTDGVGIDFNRLADGNTKYPLTDGDGRKIYLRGLNFQPSGGDEFEVSGSIKYARTNDKGVIEVDGNDNEKLYSVDCRVVRELDDDGNAHLYVYLNNYRFEIRVDYRGDNDPGNNHNTYSVSALDLVINAYSAEYVSDLALWYRYLGSSAFQMVSNNNGAIWITQAYDEHGDITGITLRGIFLQNSGILNSKNAIIGNVEAACTENENGTYTVTFVDTGEAEETDPDSGEVIQEAREGDNQTYKLTVALDINDTFGVAVYSVVSFTREQELVTADGNYKALTEKLISSEYYSNTGELYVIQLKNSADELIESKEVFYIGEDLYYISRETGTDDKIVKTTYYKVVLTSEIDTSAGANNKVSLYKSVEVTESTATTVYNADGSNYADILNGEIKLFYIGEDVYRVTECSFDGTSTYTVKTGDDTYTVVVEGGVLGTITKVNEEQA